VACSRIEPAQQALYLALEQSALFKSCEELDQAAATFATVQVEFRAPSHVITDRLVERHEELAAGMASMFANDCGARRRALQDKRTEASAAETERALQQVAAEHAAALAAHALEAGRAAWWADIISEQAQTISERDVTISQQHATLLERDAAMAVMAATIARLEAAAYLAGQRHRTIGAQGGGGSRRRSRWTTSRRSSRRTASAGPARSTPAV
jgi:hypothetical protein